MPAKNSLKVYQEGGYYHLYNRGVEKRNIFIDDQDYSVLLTYLKEYLESKPVIDLRDAIDKLKYREKDEIVRKLIMKNYSDEIKLLAFCLMPNHYHFLLKQKKARGIEEFMRSLFTRYVKYFNTKYSRVGGLFQGVYKGVNIKDDVQLIQLTRYIHQNPSSLSEYYYKNYIKYPYSSLGAYLGKQNLSWLKKSEILRLMPSLTSAEEYKRFVQKAFSKKESKLIENLLLER